LWALSEVTVFYASNLMMPFSLKISKIDRLMPIVGGTQEISNREICLLNQELNFLTDRVAAEISDGAFAGRRSFLQRACRTASQPKRRTHRRHQRLEL
jgi:hypothetical protein